MPFFSLLGNDLPIVRTRNDSIPPSNNFFNRRFYTKAAKHYTVSAKYMIDTLKSMGIKNRYISAVPLAIDYQSFAEYIPGNNLKKNLKISDKDIVVSYIGRLHGVKGVEYFVKSYSHLSDRERFHFIISGEEIDVSINDLKEIAQNLNIKKITFLERQSDVREILSITDIGVIPSIGSEAICRIALEMLSFGIPIVGSNINSIPEIINEFAGIIVQPKNSMEIANALEELAHNDNYKIMRQEIQSRMERLSTEKFVIEYLDIYSKVLNKEVYQDK